MLRPLIFKAYENIWRWGMSLPTCGSASHRCLAWLATWGWRMCFGIKSHLMLMWFSPGGCHIGSDIGSVSDLGTRSGFYSNCFMDELDFWSEMLRVSLAYCFEKVLLAWGMGRRLLHFVFGYFWCSIRHMSKGMVWWVGNWLPLIPFILSLGIL